MGNNNFVERQTFSWGRTIFREGEIGSRAYIVQSGRVQIIKNLDDDKKGTLGYVEAGGIFGEMALIDNSPRMATAIADEATVCIVVSEQMLKKKLASTDPVVKMILTVLIRLLRNVANSTKLEAIDLEKLTETLTNKSVNFESIVTNLAQE